MKEFLKQKQKKKQWLQLSSNLKILSYTVGGAWLRDRDLLW